jgi:hypothetical protein
LRDNGAAMRCVLALLFLVRLAHADVGVVVTGDPNMQARVVDAVQRWVQDKKLALAAAPLGAAAATLVDCFVMEDMTCAKKVFAEHATAATVVYVRVDLASAQSKDYTLTVWWFTKGAEPVGDKRTCVQCDDTALAANVGALMEQLSRKGTSGKGRIKIASGGTPMTVKVDGTEIGESPIEREVDVGSHELVFVHAGEPVDVRRVGVDAGETVELTAPHIADDRRGAPGRRRSRVLPGALLVGGVVSAAVGGVLLYYGSLRGPDQPYVYKNATEIGLPLTIAGAFAVGAGIGVAGTF